jgi:hypothetical protein
VQPLLDGPRASLSAAAVKGLLQSHSAIQFNYGAEALDGDFGLVADISDYMGEGSSITCDVTQTVHRTCTLNIDSDVTDTGWSYLSGFVKPYMTITDVATGVAARFDLGVYTLTTPQRDMSTSPASLAFQGYDLCYLLRQEVGDSYEVASGTDPAQAAADVIGLAIPEVTVIVTPSGSTLPTQLTWPFDPSQPTTYLDIVDVLLASIGYRQVWVDWEGQFRVEPFIDLQDETFEWTFDRQADDSIVAEQMTQNVDVYDVPNWFRFVMADQTATPVEGTSQFTWIDSSPLNPGSTYNRGRTIRYIEAVTANTYDDLTNYAQRKIVDLLSPGEQFAATTQPFPLAWHLDVIQFLDDNLDVALPSSPGGERRVVAVGWSLPLDGNSDMTWTWQTVTDQTAALGLTTIED